MTAPRWLSFLGVATLGRLAASPAPDATSSIWTPPVALCASRATASVAPRHEFATDIIRAIFNHLTAMHQHELIDALQESVSRREAQQNPLAEDFGEGDPDARLDRIINSAPQRFATARALLAERYCASDGYCVRVAPSDKNCTLHEYVPHGQERHRAMFLAWPWAYAKREHIASSLRPRDREEQLAALRRRPDVALVLEGGGSNAPMSEPERLTVELFQRHEALVRMQNARNRGEPLPDARDQVRSESWVMGSDDVLLIPTLEIVAAHVAREADERLNDRTGSNLD